MPPGTEAGKRRVAFQFGPKSKEWGAAMGEGPAARRHRAADGRTTLLVYHKDYSIPKNEMEDKTQIL